MMRLSFFGGAGGVTGACYHIEIEKQKILVDCGLFQGNKFAECANDEPFAFNASEVAYVCVTHAHADHIGRLPKLYKEGFRGKIIATPPTYDLSDVMLHDALKTMTREREEEHSSPLYLQEDLLHTLKFFETHPYNSEIRLNETTSLFLRDSGHILGSAMIEMHIKDRIIVFTGDLGNAPTPFLNGIYPIEFADYVVMESVYGDRLHEEHEERKLMLERAIEDIVTSKGTLIIPVFALERTQVLLAELNELVEHNRIPRIPIFLDSPLAINATAVYKKYEHLFNPEAQSTIKKGDDLFKFPGLTLSATREESIRINDFLPPKIILAGNPHGYGSRITHHFLRYLPEQKNVVLFVGYSRVSSLGRMLCDGARHVTIRDKTIPVNARILTISGYSAHADQTQLKEFVAHINKPIKNVFVVMGEKEASRTLARVLSDEVGVHATVPHIGDVVELE